MCGARPQTTSDVTRLAWSDDGLLLALSPDSGVLRLYNGNNGLQLLAEAYSTAQVCAVVRGDCALCGLPLLGWKGCEHWGNLRAGQGVNKGATCRGRLRKVWDRPPSVEQEGLSPDPPPSQAKLCTNMGASAQVRGRAAPRKQQELRVGSRSRACNMSEQVWI
eukprot:296770-Chlamydomonas_euryale.AAC.3